MDDTRLPKIAFYCELEHGTRSLGGQRKRFKDMLKSNMKACDMQPNELESLTSDRSSWRTLFKKQVSVFEDNRVQSLQDKCAQRKTSRQPPPDRDFACDICMQSCMHVKNWSLLTSTYSHHFVIRRSVVSTAQSIIIITSRTLQGHFTKLRRKRKEKRVWSADCS